MLGGKPVPAGRCIYCAFRSRQLALQARRHRTTNYSTSTFTIHKDYGRSDYEEVVPAQGNLFRKHARSPDLEWERKAAPRKHGKGKVEYGKSRGRDPPAFKENYNDILHKRMNELKEELSNAPILDHLQKEKQDAGEKAESFSKLWKSFARKVYAPGSAVFSPAWVSKDSHSGRQADFETAYRTGGVHLLDSRIKYAFYGHVTGSRFTESDIKNQKALADLRYPTEWYPATRTHHRTIHLHVGPTNSGKTYQALQRLEKAKKGVYAGPLRLLAHEVYTRMNAKGRGCSLITGEERRPPPDENFDANRETTMSACTVEMVPLNHLMDVAVIDEIQMIGNAERGWAWTQALLGVKAKEVHLCGEARTIPLVRELCASMGEEVHVHHYERLSPLKVAETSLDGDLRKLRKGDCIVSFSVMGIHALRRQIERSTGRKVATVYGSLPPETRAQQARLFNDPDNDYDFLVASDAVGMGLNLAIKRMIFEATSKFDGSQRRTLGVADIKQIGGRAGRYRTAAQASQEPASAQPLAAVKGDLPVTEPVTFDASKTATGESVGIVTTLDAFDFPVVAAAMAAEPEPIRTAGLYPPAAVLERFSSYFPPGTPFSFCLMRLHELSQMHSRFHLCGLRDQLHIADLIEGVEGLTVADRLVICNAPCSRGDDMWKDLMPAYAKCIAEQSGGNLLDIESLPLEMLEQEVTTSREYLRQLEQLHKGLSTYLWLSYRFAGIFTTRGLAFHVKELVEEKIEDVLGRFSFEEKERREVVKRRQKEIMRGIYEAQEEAAAEMAKAEAAKAAAAGSGEGEVDGERAALERQTSLVGGGDQFSGEAEVIGFEDEDEADAEVQDDAEAEAGVEEGAESPAGLSSFAQWRAAQTRGESQGSKEVEGDDASVEEGLYGAESAEAVASPSDEEVEVPSEEAVAIPADEEAQAPSTSEVTADPLELDAVTAADDVETPVTPQTQVENAVDEEPLSTSAAPPARLEDSEERRTPAAPPPAPPSAKLDQNQFAGSGIPGGPKHLAHMPDVEGGVLTDEPGRDAGSRP